MNGLTVLPNGESLHLAGVDVGSDSSEILAGRGVVVVDHKEPKRDDSHDQDEPNRTAAQSSNVTHARTSGRPCFQDESQIPGGAACSKV